jgi:hypothetical protein
MLAFRLVVRMDLDEMRAIVRTVSVPGYNFVILRDQHDSAWLQIESWRACVEDGKPSVWRGRKWYLSSYMTRSEIVTTCLKAVLTYVEHEVRENFRYRDKQIFGPHIDVDALAEVCDRKDTRGVP